MTTPLDGTDGVFGDGVRGQALGGGVRGQALGGGVRGQAPGDGAPVNRAAGRLTRRGLLGAGLAAGALAATGAWRSAPAGAGSPSRAGLRTPGSRPYPALPGPTRPYPALPGPTRPYPALPPGTDTIPQIEHIVVIMMENHSYDNRLGLLRRPSADGFRFGPGSRPLASNPYASGEIQHAFRMPTACQLSGHPAQDWLASHMQFDGGRLEGFVTSSSGPVAMGYWERADQPSYYSLASVFPIADRYFCSVLGQTYPNRRYLISATSIGQVDDTTPGLSDYPPNGTIFDRLDAHGITWRDYYTDLATAELYPPLYLKHLGSNVVPIARFYADAAAGTLPGVCLVEPGYSAQSEENPQNIALGEQFAAGVIGAVMSGPTWERTVAIWTYDEHGGYYDHVPPPPALAPDGIPPAVPAGQPAYDGFRRYGFRVPCAVVSAWARPGYVFHQVKDHTSICALIEAKWNLPAMTYRDANADPMLDMLDLRRPAFREAPRLARPLASTDPGALACSVSGPRIIPPAGSVSPPPG